MSVYNEGEMTASASVYKEGGNEWFIRDTTVTVYKEGKKVVYQ